jgi:hypothetical protein
MPATASHSWGGYHWARTANPFTLKVVDSNSADWDGYLSKALSDWSQSAVLDLTIAGSDDSDRARKRCAMVRGQIRSCNYAHGLNGWLGLASIHVRGGHITQGTSQMNDSYFNAGRYTSTNRQHVMCQEIGHDFGLDHQDESGADLNTCMDYDDSLGNPTPNAHDYAQLEAIYAHGDSSSTNAGSVGSVGEVIPSWAPASQRARSVYVDQLPDGGQLVTFVLWANPIHGWG